MRGIRFRLLLVVALAALPALVVFGALLAIEDRQAAEHTRLETHREVELNAVAFETFFGQTRGLLSAVAATPVVRRGTDEAALRAFLQTVLARNSGDYLNLGLLDLHGKLLFSLVPAPSGLDLSDRRWFARALSTSDMAVGDFQASPISGADSIVAAMPVMNDKAEPSGVLFATIPVSRLEAALVDPRDEGVTNLLIDSTGYVIARRPPLASSTAEGFSESDLVRTVLNEGAGSAQIRGLDGVERLYAFAPAYRQEEQSMFVATGMPASAAFAATRNRLLFALGLVLPSALFAALVALMMADRTFARPLRALASAARGIGQGDWTARQRLPVARDEIGALSREFDAMASTLEAHMSELESTRMQLARANVKLDEAVRQRTSELLATNRELEAFSYSVSHDLRAPLRAVDGFSQALLEEYADRLEGDGTDYLNRIRSAARRMGQLIDSMLQLSHLSRKEIQRSSVDLSSLAIEAAEDVQAANRDHLVRVTVQPGMRAIGDPELIRLLLHNLLGNAWKFTGPRPDAHVEVGEVSSEGARAFFVRDNGVGFDMAYSDKLFGAFQRLHSNTEFAGQGIGLATVARVVHRHGGEVWAEGTPGQGATFFFTIPDTPPTVEGS